MNSINEHQPAPNGNGERVLDWVIKDLLERAENGKLKYGCYLQTGNGRNPLIDAYQEALDLAMYLRQAILESEQECVWTLNSSFSCETSCGYNYYFLSNNSEIQKREFTYCPYCGLRIKAVV